MIRNRGQLSSVFVQELEKPSDVVNASLSQVAKCHHCLEPLLDRLLGVETDDAVGDFGIAGELANSDCILASLSG